MMKIQVLVATMHQTDHTLPARMGLRTDAIIANQCDRNAVEEFDFQGYCIKMYSFAERGVGLNRNNALMRADGDICLFADDDMVYMDNYEEVVRRSFECLPDADVIVFNLKETPPLRRVNRRVQRVSWHNYLRYGTARIAVRLASVRLQGIFFNQCFGGGTAHRRGEDNLFLTECLRKGLKIYAVPDYIAELTDTRASTCNKTEDDQYFHDTGILFKVITRRWWRLLCLQDALRHAKRYKIPWYEAYKKMTDL